MEYIITQIFLFLTNFRKGTLTKTGTSKLKKKGTIKSEIISLIIIIILALAVRIFFIEIFYVPTGSMKPTILEGDYIFSTKYNYGYSIYSIPFNPDIFEGRILSTQPKRGDIIIIRPPHNMQERYIKRLIGLPGDKIEIINDVIHINDTPVERVEIRQYIAKSGVEFTKFKETLPNGFCYFSYKIKYLEKELGIDHSSYGPKFVEEGHYFFMGDNRDMSGDSRYQLGTVPFRNLIAKGQFIVFSTEEALWDFEAGFIEQLGRFRTWVASIRFNRLFSNLYDCNIDNDN